MARAVPKPQEIQQKSGRESARVQVYALFFPTVGQKSGRIRPTAQSQSPGSSESRYSTGFDRFYSPEQLVQSANSTHEFPPKQQISVFECSLNPRAAQICVSCLPLPPQTRNRSHIHGTTAFSKESTARKAPLSRDFPGTHQTRPSK